MKKRFKIVTNDENNSFLHDNTGEYENLPVEDPDDFLIKFLVNRANETPEYNKATLIDMINGLERNLSLVEKLFESFSYVARRYFKENPQDMTNRKNQQFLLIGDKTINHSFYEMWNNIKFLKREKPFNEWFKPYAEDDPEECYGE